MERCRHTRIGVTCVVNPLFNKLSLSHHISGDEAVGDFVLTYERVEIYPSVKALNNLSLVHADKRTHIGEIHLAEPVERSGQSLHRGADGCNLVNGKCYRAVEDVSLYEQPVVATFKGESVTPVGVHFYELHILTLVEMPEFLHELIIILVEMFAQFGTCLVCFRLVMVELLICFRQGNIQHGAFLLLRLELERCEGGSHAADLREKADLTSVAYH